MKHASAIFDFFLIVDPKRDEQFEYPHIPTHDGKVQSIKVLIGFSHVEPVTKFLRSAWKCQLNPLDDSVEQCEVGVERGDV